MTRNVNPRRFNVVNILQDHEQRILQIERELFRARPLLLDTGWISRAADLASGVSEDLSFDSRRIGRTVYWRGRVEPDTNWGAAFSNTSLIADVGDAWTPAVPFVEVMSSGDATEDEWFRLLVNSNGNMALRPQQASSPSSVYITASYVVDNPFS